MESGNTFSIIGCGLTGTSMLYQFVQRFAKIKHRLQNRPITLHLFERGHVMGPGLPYDKDLTFPFHISNMPTCDMSIDADQPDDFIRWFERHQQTLFTKFPAFERWVDAWDIKQISQACLTRMIMGEYLKSRFLRALEMAAAQKIQVVLHEGCEVIHMAEDENRVKIEAKDAATDRSFAVASDRVLLATGHWNQEAALAGVFSSPWPAGQLLEKIPEGARVAVIGTGLTAIDTALSLLSDGLFSRDKNRRLVFTPSSNSREVTLYSRGGLLPRVRGQSGPYQNRFFCQSNLKQLLDQHKGEVSLETLFSLLNQEMETAYGRTINWDQFIAPPKGAAQILKQNIQEAIFGDNGTGDILWQTILFQSIEVIRQAYVHLKPNHRLWFEKKFKSAFMAHASPMPLVNAQKILGFLESGVLKIKRLTREYQLIRMGDQYEFCYGGDNKTPVKEHFPFVVDGRGQSANYRDNPSPLAKNILSSGLVEMERIQHYKVSGESDTGFPAPLESGSLWIDPFTQQVVTTNSRNARVRSPRIFAVGMMTQGQVITASMARECAGSARRVADRFLDALCPNAPA